MNRQNQILVVQAAGMKDGLAMGSCDSLTARGHECAPDSARRANGNAPPRRGTKPEGELAQFARQRQAGAPQASSALRAFSSVACVHELFEAQVAERPDAVALTFGQQQLSYRELNRRANRMAHYLRDIGVGPEIPVAICLERSPEMVVCLLAILKAGAVYVPLDPASPLERLAFMLEETRTRVLLTSRRQLSTLPDRLTPVLTVEDAEELLARQRDDNPNRVAVANSAAYIIYTSGSTGQPKGVVVEHGNVVHLIRSRQTRYPDPVERFALAVSVAFDASVIAIFGTLSVGGTLSLAPQGAEQDPVRLAQWIEQQRITHWLSVPSLYSLLLDQPIRRLASLRVAIVGGEVCPLSLVQRHNALLPSTTLYNEYGPTEGTVCSTVYRCPRTTGESLVPIGRPIPNVQLYVLDASMNSVPCGMPGELYLGGAGVARGYLRQPNLTDERFVSDPFETAGGRLYKTGDLARCLPDGNVEFLGRIDNQVKVRGYRVELGEIEAALRRCADVAEVMVQVAEAKRGQQHLVAYIVARDSRALSPVELRQSLRGRLPRYMIPAYFVFLDALLLTPGGKIDRCALPSVDRQSAARQGGYTTAADPTEERLAAIWSAVFELEPIGVCDDFFDLGGDSLIAAALCARMEEEFGQALSLDVLLEHPTIRLLAHALRQPTSHDAKSAAVTIRSGAEPCMFCLPGIGGNVLEFRALASQLGEGQGVFGLRPVGLDDGRPAHESIVEMAAHNIRLMRQIQPRGPYQLVGYSLGGVVAFEMAQQLRDANETTGLLALLDSQLWSEPIALKTAQKLRLHWKNLWHSSRRGRWHYLRERVRLLFARLRRGDIRQAEDDVIEGLDLSPSSRKVARIHWHAWRRYQPRLYDGVVTLFVAQRHPELAAAINGSDSTLGWSRWTTQPVRKFVLAATHAELLHMGEPPLLAEQLATLLRAAIDDATNEPATLQHPKEELAHVAQET